MIKTAGDFLSLAALKRSKVEVKGKEICIRELSVSERGKFLSLARESPADVPAWIVATCAIDPDGGRLLSDDEAAQVAQSSPEVVDVIANAIIALSGFGSDASPNA